MKIKRLQNQELQENTIAQINLKVIVILATEFVAQQMVNIYILYSGCNCYACMKLDLITRGIPLKSGKLINNQGNICILQDNRFYCGCKMNFGVS